MKKLKSKKYKNVEEIWNDIEGLEGVYQVSNIGRVKSWTDMSTAE